MDTFGEKICYLRKSKQKTQDEIALAVGTTKSTISKYERNLVDPTLESAKNLADYFMVSLDWLAGNSNSEKDGLEINIPNSYIEVIKKALRQEIPADNLNEALNFITKIKKYR